MDKVWKIVGVMSAVLVILGVVLMATGYATGSSIQRVVESTDILDMTKFFTREQLDTVVRPVLSLFLGQ